MTTKQYKILSVRMEKSEHDGVAQSAAGCNETVSDYTRGALKLRQATGSVDSGQDGWLQCNQCGHGHSVTRAEVDAGDYKERGACPHCEAGVTTIDWHAP